MREVEVAVLGAGFAGLGAGIQLVRRGIDSFVILEASDDVGGTWRENTYPGVECDVPSHLYSFSFLPNPRWSKTYGTGAEIQAYLRRCAEENGVLDRIRFNTRARRAEWDRQTWIVTPADGEVIRARFLISGLGGLHTPNVPSIAGADTFQGPSFHTARWRHDVALAGRRIGMIGTGATAVQAAPRVAAVADSFALFQRSPIWVAPKRDVPYSDAEQRQFADDPDVMQRHRHELWQQWEETGVEAFTPGSEINATFEAAARRNIERNVHDPVLAAQLTPTFNVTCKRPTYSNEYYPMFNRPNVRLVTDPIAAITPDGIATATEEIALDVIVYATGFKPFDITTEIDILGLDATPLRDAWRYRITSYKSMMVHGYPNLFILLGPNSAGLTSAVEMIEAGVSFAIDAIENVRRNDMIGVHPTTSQVRDFTAQIDRLTADTTVNKGCTSWWTAGGQNHALWPSSSARFRSMLEQVDLGELAAISSDPGSRSTDASP